MCPPLYHVTCSNDAMRNGHKKKNWKKEQQKQKQKQNRWNSHQLMMVMMKHFSSTFQRQPIERTLDCSFSRLPVVNWREFIVFKWKDLRLFWNEMKLRRRRINLCMRAFKLVSMPMPDICCSSESFSLKSFFFGSLLNAHITTTHEPYHTLLEYTLDTLMSATSFTITFYSATKSNLIDSRNAV